MLLINNNLSKAYLQNLLENNFMPNKILVLNDQNLNLVEHTNNDKFISKNTNQKFIRKSKDLRMSFDEKKHILKTIEENEIEHTIIDNIDINSEVVINEVAKINDKYIVFSGPDGSILGQRLLSKGKQFIHAHPGWLPKFKGSSTIYYTMLLELKIGCSILILEKDIDDGPILHRKSFKILEKKIDFDYCLDPLVRANTLISFFKTEKIAVITQEKQEDSGMFYIIHPLLKHISILKSVGKQ